MASARCQAHKMFPIKWAPLGLVVEPSRKRAAAPKPEPGLSGDRAGSSRELPKTPRFCSEGISKPPSSHSPGAAGKGQRCLGWVRCAIALHERLGVQREAQCGSKVLDGNQGCRHGHRVPCPRPGASNSLLLLQSRGSAGRAGAEQRVGNNPGGGFPCALWLVGEEGQPQGCTKSSGTAGQSQAPLCSWQREALPMAAVVWE